MDEQEFVVLAGGLGEICSSCRLCFLTAGKLRYAIYECLPEGWDYSDVTFLTCTSCGTAHAVEHASQEGKPDRLRAKTAPVFLPFSPKMRRLSHSFSRWLKKEVGHHWKEPKTRYPKYPEPGPINLLPTPQWKRRISELYERFKERAAHYKWFASTRYARFRLKLEALRRKYEDNIWERKHPRENWQKHKPIWVTSPETFDLRVQQLRENHLNFESLWPVVAKTLPARKISDEDTGDTDAKNLYADLSCSYCDKLGTLGYLPRPAKQPYPYYGNVWDCPGCKCRTVTYDVRFGLDLCLYLGGDILYRHIDFSRELIKWERVSPLDAEIEVERITNRGLKPHAVSHSVPEGTPPIPPGHTYEIHTKYLERTRRHDSKVVTVLDDEKIVCEAKCFIRLNN
jgi:hypothetical protein